MIKIKLKIVLIKKFKTRIYDSYIFESTCPRMRQQGRFSKNNNILNMKHLMLPVY